MKRRPAHRDSAGGRAAYAYRHSQGLPYAYADNELSYTENFMNMLWKKTELRYKSSRVLAHALAAPTKRCCA